MSVFDYLSFRQIFDLIAAAIEADLNDKLFFRWVINGEPAGISWDEFVKTVKKRKQVETPDETYAKIAAIFDDPTITWKKQTLSEVTARYGNI